MRPSRSAFLGELLDFFLIKNFEYNQIKCFDIDGKCEKLIMFTITQSLFLPNPLVGVGPTGQLPHYVRNRDEALIFWP